MKKFSTLRMIAMMSLLSMSAFAETFTWKSFDEFKLDYFSKMDYFDPQVAKDIPPFERRLLKHSEAIMAKPDSEQTKDDANFLAYTALFLLNTKGAFFANTVKQSDLDDSQTFTTSTVLKDIYIARHQHVVDLLVQADKIFPDHRLVRYWLLGSQVSLALLENREPTEEQVQALVKQAKANAFGFFNTYITMKEVNMNDHVKYSNPLIEKALDQSAGRMLLLQLPKGEGLTKKQMKEGAKFVPFMILGSLTALAEYFAVRATEVAENNIKKAKMFKLKAQMSLMFTRVPLISGFKMYKWNRLEQKRELADFVTKFDTKENNHKMKDMKLSKETTLKIISCASCHTNPIGKN
jgi:hypothetical protein